jgi:hypothetical protein
MYHFTLFKGMKCGIVFLPWTPHSVPDIQRRSEMRHNREGGQTSGVVGGKYQKSIPSQKRREGKM